MYSCSPSLQAKPSHLSFCSFSSLSLLVCGNPGSHAVSLCYSQIVRQVCLRHLHQPRGSWGGVEGGGGSYWLESGQNCHVQQGFERLILSNYFIFTQSCCSWSCVSGCQSFSIWDSYIYTHFFFFLWGHLIFDSMTAIQMLSFDPAHWSLVKMVLKWKCKLFRIDGESPPPKVHRRLDIMDRNYLSGVCVRGAFWADPPVATLQPL